MSSQQPRKIIEFETSGMFDTSKIIDNFGCPKKRVNADKFCAKHGIQYSEIEFDVFRCATCEAEKKEAKRAEAALVEKKAMAEKALVFPQRLRRYTLKNYTPATSQAKEVLRKCCEFVSRWPAVGGLLMLGGVGTGKTHLAVAICQALRDEKTAVCHLTTVSKIVRAVRSSWGKRAEMTEQEIIRRYVDYDLLVIDEIGSQYGSDGERIIINEIINDRYEQARPSIIIGNVSLSEASQILGTRSVDRIKDGGMMLFFEWDSYRQEGRNNAR